MMVRCCDLAVLLLNNGAVVVPCCGAAVVRFEGWSYVQEQQSSPPANKETSGFFVLTEPGFL